MHFSLEYENAISVLTLFEDDMPEKNLDLELLLKTFFASFIA